MNYYLLQPEIAGELGDSSEITYEDGRVKEVQFLEFVFTRWLGDEILKARPCYIITKDIMNSGIEDGITGAKYEEIKVSFSEDFLDMYENMSDMPMFVRLLPINKIDNLEENMEEDIYFDKYNRLVVSEKTMKILEKYRIDNCDVEKVK